MDKKKRKETFSAYSWSAASLILILLIVIFPILYTAYISLTNMNVYHWNNYELIGLKNYDFNKMPKLRTETEQK